MNLGIITASIAPLRPLFVNLGPMDRVSSDKSRWLNTSDRPFAKMSKASKAGIKPSGILLSSMDSTKTNNVDVSQDIPEANKEGV